MIQRWIFYAKTVRITVAVKEYKTPQLRPNFFDSELETNEFEALNDSAIRGESKWTKLLKGNRIRQPRLGVGNAYLLNKIGLNSILLEEIISLSVIMNKDANIAKVYAQANMEKQSINISGVVSAKVLLVFLHLWKLSTEPQ
jgi:hypothetical protein